MGSLYLGDSSALIKAHLLPKLKGKVDLILTSPPFPLNNKKSYGNLTGEEYRKWFVGLADLYSQLLSPKGSIVIELGNSWVPGRPIQSLLHLESLIGFVNAKNSGLRLCQQFVCYNPSRLPSPAQWVTINRERLTDSYTHVWWMAKDDHPKANNKNVLRPYSASMEELLVRQSYNSGKRPSQHVISDESFLINNGGSIAPNFIEAEPMGCRDDWRMPNAFRFSNTGSNDFYHTRCRELELTPHPARMPGGLAAFFIEFLTDKKDLVLDPFAGSNTTGYLAEKLGRRWISFEIQPDYIKHSKIRFEEFSKNGKGHAHGIRKPARRNK